ncbi:hypothetical protein V6N12_004425 [Hibiscus sabdariffa]|uniref:Uncharacterized protein n=1 Tax=Hibiscus sabdariffa TaxID=183260 RepID=A0ABR2CLF4_9ROSI
MAPSGASGSGEFRWTDLFEISSTGNSETSVNPPGPEASVNQAPPDLTSPNPAPEPALNPAIIYSTSSFHLPLRSIRKTFP